MSLVKDAINSRRKVSTGTEVMGLGATGATVIMIKRKHTSKKYYEKQNKKDNKSSVTTKIILVILED